MKWIVFLLSTGILFMGLFAASEAHAASVTFTSPVNLLLTSPTTTLTIATGSIADVVTVNATSVVISMSGGEAFTLLSPSYDLAVATSSGGGNSVTNTCTSGLVTAALSETAGSTAYTITPGGTLCSGASAPLISSISVSSLTSDSATILWTTNIAADSTVSYGTTASYGATSTNPILVTAHSISLSNLNANTLYYFAVTSAENGTSTVSGANMFTTPSVTSTPTSSGGVGVSVGVPSAYGSPSGPDGGSVSTVSSTTELTTTPSSTAKLQAELNALLAELATLEAEANASGSSTTISFSYVFTRNLYQGITGSDVTELQKFLILENKGPAARALEKHGVTKNFATLTLAALKEFQSAVGISPAIGYFGPITRRYVDNLMQ